MDSHAEALRAVAAGRRKVERAETALRAALAQRDEAIVAARSTGLRVQSIAEAAQISGAMCYRIVAAVDSGRESG